MKQSSSLLLLVLLALLVVGCAPSITVENKTGFGVTAIVTSGGQRSVLSPSPGESSATDAAEGVYTVAVVPSTEWIEYAKLTRKFLNDQLANHDKLSGPQLLDIIKRLKDIAAKMYEFENATQGLAGTSCSGKLTQDADSGLAEINLTPDGKMVVSCK